MHDKVKTTKKNMIIYYEKYKINTSYTYNLRFRIKQYVIQHENMLRLNITKKSVKHKRNYSKRKHNINIVLLNK